MGRSDKGVWGLGAGTEWVMSATRQSCDIHTKSSENRISFIQKEDAWPPSKTNSIPDWGARLSRPESPWVRSDGVLATSATNTTPPIATDCAVREGVGVAEGDGVTVMVGLTPGVGAGVGVLDGVGMTTGVGVLDGVGMTTGVGVLDGVGMTTGVGVLDGVGMTTVVGVLDGVSVVTGVGVLDGVGVTTGVGVLDRVSIVTGVGVLDGVSVVTVVGVPDGVGVESCSRTGLWVPIAGGVGATAVLVAVGVAGFGLPHPKHTSSTRTIRE